MLKFANDWLCRQKHIRDYEYDDNLWYKITKRQDNQQSTACYAFSRKAMKFYIDEMYNRFIYADGVFLNFLGKDLTIMILII